MIKNIIFYLSEVIISGYHGIENLIQDNTDVSAKEFYKRKQETMNVFFDAMRGKYSEDEYLDILLNETNWNITKKDLKKLIRKTLNIPVEGTLEIVKKLSEEYNLILLSDHIKEWMDYIFENNLELNIFKKKYFSYEYGKLKSDEGCFEYVLKDANINANETLFIDDYENNVEMAKRSKIDVILFKSAEDLEKELENRNILKVKINL